MDNQKLENLLNLALEATPEELEKSKELQVGYIPEERAWELIVKHVGSLENLRETGIDVYPLLSGFSILKVPQSRIDEISRLPEIEYIEKPKRLLFAVDQAKAASCINPLQTGIGSTVEEISQDLQQGERTDSVDLGEERIEEGMGAGQESQNADVRINNLSGAGVLVGIADSGIDFYINDFRNPDGTTRIVYLWDQLTGKVYTQNQINAALGADSEAQVPGTQATRRQAEAAINTFDGSGHGTAVAGIAAGGGRDNPLYRGIAYGSELLVVKLGNAAPDGFPRTTELMKAVNFIIETAVELGRPVAVNISFGNTYGPHNGSGLLESFFNEIADYGKNVLCIGAGNEGATGGHKSGRFEQHGGSFQRSLRQESVQNREVLPIRQRVPGQETGSNQGSGLAGAVAVRGDILRMQEVELSVSDYETGFGVQLWKTYGDEIEVLLVALSGEVIGPFRPENVAQTYIYRGTKLLVYYGMPSPYSMSQELYIDLIPMNTYLDSGIWKFQLIPGRIIDGRYDLWLPSAGVINPATIFLGADPEYTMTIPAFTSEAVAVAAYDDYLQSYADFSGRGYPHMGAGQQVKPDIAAPGVNIMAVSRGGGYAPVTGTSFATPVVTGSCALLMEWGIVRGNDPYLAGEKIKAYLIKGARQLPGLLTPNPMTGWGVLCVRDSLPL